jgi:hypothetical protein
VDRAALLTASGRPLPELSRILSAHSLIHAADGEFFRDALLDACRKHKLAIRSIKESELGETACAGLGHNKAALARFVRKLGKPLGAPWSQDEKFALLAAWLALLDPLPARRT